VQKQLKSCIPGFQLPLALGGFIGSMAEATQILLAGLFSCLWSWAASSDQWQRQPNSCLPGSSVAFILIKLHQQVKNEYILNILLNFQKYLTFIFSLFF
jgi:hypothetical protein